MSRPRPTLRDLPGLIPVLALALPLALPVARAEGRDEGGCWPPVTTGCTALADATQGSLDRLAAGCDSLQRRLQVTAHRADHPEREAARALGGLRAAIQGLRAVLSGLPADQEALRSAHALLQQAAEDANRAVEALGSYVSLRTDWERLRDRDLVRLDEVLAGNRPPRS